VSKEALVVIHTNIVAGLWASFVTDGGNDMALACRQPVTG